MYSDLIHAHRKCCTRMAASYPSEDLQAALEAAIGYLNFSSGAHDPRFFCALDQLLVEVPPVSEGVFNGLALEGILTRGVARLKGKSPAFSDTAQAEQIMELVFSHVVPTYLKFHEEILFHHRKDQRFNAFMVGRFFEATLKQGGPWTEVERISQAAVRTLSDYVGHRPLATLENQKHVIPIDEKVRPVPLYLSEAGVAQGPYAEVVSLTLDILKNTDESILEAAHFSLDHLDELSFDPRAYDFDHPVNRRPNYHFGQWDPHQIDKAGYYRRFVIQQVTLEALHQRIDGKGEIPREELVFEAAAVLAGTILMASGISGRGPGAISADVPLTSLLAVIARYRDQFYDGLMSQLAEPQASRLKSEAEQKRQAFGAARQHINSELARQRESQMEHVHLARIYARMGYLEDAQREANIVPVASARTSSQIDCALMAGHQAIGRKAWKEARQNIIAVVETLRRSIACGAQIDPWNILGFDAQYTLFSGLENSIQDHRADEILSIVERIFELCSRFWNEATSAREEESVFWISEYFEQLAQWWHQFATHEVTSVEGVNALASFQASKHVAECLKLWHEGGGGNGDVEFWASHASRFDSPTAFALVVEALLDQGDFLASRGLLMQWLGDVEEIPLEQNQTSFFDLAYRWILLQLGRMMDSETGIEDQRQISREVTKWFDFLEANAEDFWTVPQFESPRSSQVSASPDPELDEEENDPGNDLYGAAYDDVVYQDSTNDGIDGSVFEQADFGFDELERESRRVSQRLFFLSHLSRMWKVAAFVGVNHIKGQAATEDLASEFLESLGQWTQQAQQNQRALQELLRQVHNYQVARPGVDHDSMLEYDRQRLLKENLIEQVIGVCVDTVEAYQSLLATQMSAEQLMGQVSSPKAEVDGLDADQVGYVQILASAMRHDRDAVEQEFEKFCNQLVQQPLLYVPLAKGGDPHKIVSSRIRRMAIQELLVTLPRLGLIEATHHLLELAREMEQAHPVGQGAVTEFDELFKIGYCSMVEAITEWAPRWREESNLGELLGEDVGDENSSRETRLFLAIERLAERSLITWLEHSKTLRLSVLEKVGDRDSWNQLVNFVKTYGGDLFTQRFFNLGNLRAILHQGAHAWLQQLQEQPGDYQFKLLDDIDDVIGFDDACRWLTLVLEAIIENYAEYRDYNSTTTQSDRGELLYMLLDFLRLRVRYDRVAWHLKPVIWSHERLVRRGCQRVAKRWRRAVRQRIGQEPQRYLDRLEKLQQKYAMQMPSIAERIHERFLMPMRVDRIRAYVKDAIEHRETEAGKRAIESLRLETRMLTYEPTGAGLELPTWLASLEDEVEQVVNHVDWDIELSNAIVPRIVDVDEADLFDQLVRLHDEVEEEFEEGDESTEAEEDRTGESDQADGEPEDEDSSRQEE